jgi:8-oxo-dGTP pyrophosphatase MutT (NUDIX family)
VTALPRDLAQLERRLVAHRPDEVEGDPPPRRAAVAIVLRGLTVEPQLLLMRRAEHPEDPWSGQISFPGGGHDVGDTDLLATAVRETHEEVGIDLTTSARLLCRLNTVQAMARGRRLDMDITPFVFGLQGEPSLVPNEETAEAFWIPLAPLATGELQIEYDYEHAGVVMKLPAWRYEGHVIWGLTHRMIAQLLDVATSRS